MKVFKTCNTIIKRRITAMALYFLIFLALTVIMPILTADQHTLDFFEMKPNFTVINRDGDTPLSEGLAAYLGARGNKVVLDDRLETLQDASFYRATDYIIILPQGFRDAFFSGGTVKIKTVATTDSAKGFYVDMLINQYLNQARFYGSPDGMGEEALAAAVIRDLSAETRVETKRFGAGAPISTGFLIYNRMLSYMVIILIILCVSNTTSAFRRPDMRMRNLCSPLKPRSMSLQQILCGVLVSAAVWVSLTVLGFIMYGSELAAADRRTVGLILLNTLVITLLALSVASLVSSFIRSANSQNAAANFVSLGLCFLGGVFVPLDLFGEGLLMASRFTPVYWYSTALDNIFALTSFEWGVMAPIWQAMLTQLIFTAAFFCLALVIGKHINQSEKSFSSVQTELDA